MKIKKKGKPYTIRNWIETANKSKDFDSFKVYIIELWDDDERFIKIGRTFKKLESRFIWNKKSNLPYDYKIIQVHEGNPFHMYKLEKKLHRKYKNNKYKPIKSFSGCTECFIDIEL